MTGKLVLFDIDGTLLSARGASLDAFADALARTFGTSGDIHGYSYSGKTDPQIVRELMLGAGLAESEIEPRIGDCLDTYRELFLERFRPEKVVPKPGVPTLVERLAAEPDVEVGILSGNLEATGRKKLEPLDINRFTPFGAWGSDHEIRAELPAIAIDRAREATGRRFAGDEVVIVGDSIHDVRCGRHLGVRAVSVTTGPTTREELEAEQPAVILDDFSRTDDAIAAILGR